MRSVKAIFSILLSLSIVLPIFGCASQENTPESKLETASPISSESEEQTSYSEASQESPDSFDTYVILNDENTTINGDGVTFTDNVLSVTAPGSYLIKGTLSDGHITVNSSDTSKKVKLYFDSVNIHCNDTAPVYVEESGEETIIFLVDGSQSTLSDNADREIPESE
ncbi:MAG: carbohydrate-binding domain-containing protein, partial [Acutalibacteraceae bacterium]